MSEHDLAKMRTIAKEFFQNDLISLPWFLDRALGWLEKQDGRFELVHTSGGWKAKVEVFGDCVTDRWGGYGTTPLDAIVGLLWQIREHNARKGQ